MYLGWNLPPMRTGTGTIRRFKGDPDVCMVGLERFGQVRMLVCEPELRDYLVERYGQREGTVSDMSAIIGLHVRWVESETGMLVHVEPLAN